jgi:hypothetical protein
MVDFKALKEQLKRRKEEHDKKVTEDRDRDYKANLDRVKYLRAEKARIDAENHLLESRQKNRELRGRT